MLDKIIHYSIKHKLVIGFFTLVLIAWGSYSLTQLPIDAVPDITNNQVQVITQAPTLGAQEVEQFITAPIELALSNIANVIEKRSISRSGISVITIVFKDNVDVYWARQQVGEKLKEAEAQIPRGLGEPTLAPITTGLGEIYHYVIHTKPGFEDKYSPTDLRTIQDWIVRRQLAGTEGLAEVSGWGGFVKQYEIALDNDKLNSLNISIPEIYEALEKNNENTGGSYIEQRSSAYFIRGLGQVKSLQDIEKIVVKNVNEIPVLIRDVAKVQFGSAMRYGAVTRNGEGEVVAGITLMLKGENFNNVIKNVKERMTQIQKSLPEGVIVEPFIDRTELVGRAIGTVEKNLLEGGLIVVFILVLLLGNLRAGLVVASVIPLAMLFAISMMNLFGVSGNLMSLGAIDFGLIVDGAVIIVESIVHRIVINKSLYPGVDRLSAEQMDEEVYSAASKIRNSAAFGEIIILIVYLPLFALVGIEGKMFKPMAQTVAFAILGAFILSLTYIPMMSALFLSRKTEHKHNVSDSLMSFFHKVYEPMLTTVLRFKKITISLSILLFAFALWLFSNMGGEFIPTLEEGDLTVEISMMQGTSLSQTVKTFSKAEEIIRKEFPEVKQAVTRIGSAEIPTDPMPIERGDMMLSMKPKEEWRANSREEMQEMIEEALSVLPGVNVEVTQPMQMRFNELMTGIRQDVAIKIYGDDLDVLTTEAGKVAKLIAPVNGVSEPIVERVTGLPQIIVEYNRDKMAQYGLTISDINMILKTAFAGNVAGVVFEGEQRFDLVVRLQRELREDISNIENLFVPLRSGNKVPLSQVADVSIKDAPAQVSRENGKRRIYVGFNVRGRDVESTVEEIEKILNEKLDLPPGYYTTYGGQFQNLREANERLSIAVPTALVLILVLLYFTFHSFKQTLLIFTAIPLSAIGGVFALWLRDMPFSISAGIGFIALFGVAVLNGIVLIGYFNQLQQEGLTDIIERVKKGTSDRLRPVIMTASVASLGFLPMALSTSAGAEVQKPLATVVIGGLISATLLTLLVLPILYIIFSTGIKSKLKMPMKSMLVVILFVVMFPLDGMAQAQEVKPMSVQECINRALNDNLKSKISNLEIQQSKSLEKTGWDIDKTNVLLTQDPTSGGNIDNSLSIAQTISFPTVYATHAKVLKQQTALSEKSASVTRFELIRDVRLAYYNLLYAIERHRLLSYQDSLYANFAERAMIRYQTGETSNLEKLSAINRSKEVQLLKLQAEADLFIYQQELQKLLNTNEVIIPIDTGLSKLTIDLLPDTSAIAQNPLLNFHRQKINVTASQLKLEKNKYMPDLTVGFNRQALLNAYNPADITRSYFPGTRSGGFEIGLAIPLFFNGQQGRIQSAKLNNEISYAEFQNTSNILKSTYRQQLQQLQKLNNTLSYFETSGLQQADELLSIAAFAYSKGEIGYVEFIQNTSQAVQSKLLYIETVNNYNQTIITIEYITGSSN
jgi:cobalt-zinc-cadmium resistance protein CzcA